MQALAEVHAVDWRAAGLEGFGKPSGYLERQLRRFNGLWEVNKTRELPRVAGGGRVARLQPARVASGHDRARGLPAREHDGGRRPARAHRCGLRLGARHDRGSAGRHGLPHGHVDRARRPAGHDVQRAHGRHRREGFPTRDELIGCTRRHRPLGLQPSLVSDARTLEGRGVHGGELQALARRHHRRPLPEALRRRCARARGGRMGGGQRPGAQHVNGLLVDFGGVLTTNVFDSFRAFCASEGLDPDAMRQLFREEPEALRLVRGLETAACPRTSSGSASVRCSA